MFSNNQMSEHNKVQGRTLLPPINKSPSNARNTSNPSMHLTKRDSPSTGTEGSVVPAPSMHARAAPKGFAGALYDTVVTFFLMQLIALLYKNTILFRRNVVGTLVHVFAPGFMIILFGIIVNSSGARPEPIHPTVITTLSSSGGSGELGLPRCEVLDVVGGRFGAGKPITGAACISVLYAPASDSGVQRVVEVLAKRHGLKSHVVGATDVLSDVMDSVVMKQDIDILGFTDSARMAAFLTEDNVYGRVGFALRFGDDGLVSQANASMFDERDVEDANAPTIAYQIWTNATFDDPGLSEFRFRMGNDGGPATQIQRAVNEAIMGAHTGDNDAELRVGLKAFPRELGAAVGEDDYDDYYNSSVAISVEMFLPIFLYVGVMFSFIMTLRHIVQEKQSKILDGLRMMGLTEAAYWMSWLIYYAVLMCFSTLFVIAAGRAFSVPMFLNSDVGLMFWCIYTYFLSMVCFAMFLSTLVPTTFMAMIVGMIIFLAFFILSFMTTMPIFHSAFLYNPYTVSPALREFATLFPPIVFSSLNKFMYAYTRPYDVKVFDETKNRTVTVSESGQFEWDLMRSGSYEYLDPQFAESNILNIYNRTGVCQVMNPDYACNVHSEYLRCGPNEPYDSCDIRARKKPCTYEWSQAMVENKNQVECEAAGASYLSVLDNNKNPTTTCVCEWTVPPAQEILGRLGTLPIIYTILAWVFGQIITYGHGRAQPFWFVLLPWYWFPRLVSKPAFMHGGKRPNQPQSTSSDGDVAAEAQLVDRMGQGQGAPNHVVVDNLVKEFSSVGCGNKGVRAVDGVSLSLEPGKVFALLGHNGAGKTTCLNMILGLIGVSGGDCKINGLSVVDNISALRGHISACPQHDILWNQLSSVEHLRFYGMFQGMASSEIERQSTHLLGKVRLDSVKHNRAGSYSGGMKRRLSVVIAALGSRSVVLMDEPTTGMDPQNRRHVWDLISELKKDRVVVLTTHAMEEADALGDRIGIMSEGRLVALGRSLHLKSKFGGAYQISVLCNNATERASLIKDVQGVAAGAKISQDDVGRSGPMIFEFAKDCQAQIPLAFGLLDSKVASGAIQDWGVAQTTLEDVFIRLTRESNDNEGATTVTPPTFANHVAPIDNEDEENDNKALLTDDKEAELPNAVEVGMDPEVGRPAMFSSDTNSTDGSQLRALLRKSMVLQMRQKLTVCCQVLLPVIVLGGLKLVLVLTGLGDIEAGNDRAVIEGCTGCMYTVSDYVSQNCMYDVTRCEEILTSLGTTLSEANTASDTYQSFFQSSYEYSTIEELELAAPGIFGEANPYFDICAFKQTEIELIQELQNYYKPESCALIALQGTAGFQYSPFDWVGLSPGLQIPSRRLSNQEAPSLDAPGFVTERYNSGAKVLPYARLLIVADSRTSVVEDTKLQEMVGTRCADEVLGIFEGGEPAMMATTAHDFQNNNDFGAAFPTRQPTYTRTLEPTTRTESPTYYYYGEYYGDTNECYDNSQPFGLSAAHWGAMEPDGNWKDGLTNQRESRCRVRVVNNQAKVDAYADALDRKQNDVLFVGSGFLKHFRTEIVHDLSNWTLSNLDTSDNYNIRNQPNAFDFYQSPQLCGVSTHGAFADLSKDDREHPVSQSYLVDDLVLEAQKQVRGKRGFFANSTSTSGTPPDAATQDRARDGLHANLPDAALIFHNLHVAKGSARLDITLQSYFTGDSNQYAYWSKYPHTGLRLNSNRWNPTTTSYYKTFNYPDFSFFYPSYSYFHFGKTLGQRPINTLLNQLTMSMVSYSTESGARADDSPISVADSANLRIAVGVTQLPIRISELVGEDDGWASDSSSAFITPDYIIEKVTFLMVAMASFFIFPVLCFAIVYEKQHKLRAMMLMMGLRLRVYWLAQYVYNLILAGATLLFVYFAGMALGYGIFLRADFGIVLLLLAVWLHVLIAMAFMMSAFFNRTMLMNLMLYMVVLISPIAFFLLEMLVFNSVFTPIPQSLLAYPPFAYFRCLSILADRAVTWADIFTPGDAFGEALGILALEGLVMFALGLYLDNVLPKEYGVRRHPLFFVTDVLKMCGIENNSSDKVNVDKLQDNEVDPTEDEDVKEERDNMTQGLHREAAIQLYGLRKVYHGQGKAKVAVNNLHLHMEKGECFGMLGPNGAGKTTVISVLTGLFTSSAGRALVDGFDINTDMQSVYSVMGLCPQFDVVWPSLTVKEHLLFYVRLKGVPKEDEMENVRVAAAAVGLDVAIDRRSSRLSGGMRRRLSLAMSLVGNPNIVFLDEPTTGVDPETRRGIWSLIQREKQGRCVVLTTHSMEEADVLCDRIGIMAHGRLKALGGTQHLKTKFSDGFKLSVTFTSDGAEEGRAFVQRVAPSAKAVEQFSDTAVYMVSREQESMADVFAAFQQTSMEHGIEDWGMRQTSLEEVFVAIAKEAEEEFGMA